MLDTAFPQELADSARHTPSWRPTPRRLTNSGVQRQDLSLVVAGPDVLPSMRRTRMLNLARLRGDIAPVAVNLPTGPPSIEDGPILQRTDRPQLTRDAHTSAPRRQTA